MRKSMAPAFAGAALVLLAGCGSSGNGSGSSGAAGAYAHLTPSSSGASTTTTAAGGGAYGAGAASTSASGEGSSATAITISAKPAKLGTILAAGPKRMTVYLFEADRPGASACSGACANVWPPVRSAAASAVGAATAAALGTITRSDGSKQVTYHGHPLYYYARDKDSGDAYGQGIKSFGAAWYVLTPSGNKLDRS